MNVLRNETFNGTTYVEYTKNGINYKVTYDGYFGLDSINNIKIGEDINLKKVLKPVIEVVLYDLLRIGVINIKQYNDELNF